MNMKEDCYVKSIVSLLINRIHKLKASMDFIPLLYICGKFSSPVWHAYRYAVCLSTCSAVNDPLFRLTDCVLKLISVLFVCLSG